MYILTSLLFAFSEMSIISPTSCGFARVAAINLFNQKTDEMDNCFQSLNRNEECKQRFVEFNKQFIGYNENFNVQYKTFNKYFPKIVGSLKSLQKRRFRDRTTFLEVFSKGEWNKLVSEKKAEHKLFDCDGCMNNPKLKETLGCFIVTTRFKKLAEEKGINEKPTEIFGRESAKTFVEERVPPPPPRY